LSGRDRGCGRAGPVVVDRGLAVERRVAALTIVEHLDPFEHRVRELWPIVLHLRPVEQLGLHRRAERFRDGVVELVSGAAHRCEQSGLAQTPSERLGDMLRPVVATKDRARRRPAAPVRDVEGVNSEFGPQKVRDRVADDET
jgi:hypothetical protein